MISIEELRDLAYDSTGRPEELEFENKLVGCTKWFDGSILDVIKKVKGMN